MLPSRFLLSLVVAVSLSTLASANSITVNTKFLHSGASVSGGDHTYPGWFSINGGKPAPTTFAAFNNHTPGDWNARVGGPLSGDVMPGPRAQRTPMGSASLLRAGMHDDIRFRAPNWNGVERRQGIGAPEPGGLILLSTGLIAIAALVRRKLLRG